MMLSNKSSQQCQVRVREKLPGSNSTATLPRRSIKKTAMRDLIGFDFEIKMLNKK